MMSLNSSLYLAAGEKANDVKNTTSNVGVENAESHPTGQGRSESVHRKVFNVTFYVSYLSDFPLAHCVFCATSHTLYIVFLLMQHCGTHPQWG